MKVKMYNQSGQEKGTVELSEAMFGLPWNGDLVHQVVTSYAANKRARIAHAKGRGEVQGGGRKPWRQKGTGRARHGSIRSPIWKGGGVAHGPKKERDFSKKINKKMAKKALWTVLSAKARDGEVIAIEDFHFAEPKTKLGANLFSHIAHAKEFGDIRKGNGVLVALSQKDECTYRAMRNLPYAGVDEARNLNAYKVLQYKYIMFPESVLHSFQK